MAGSFQRYTALRDQILSPQRADALRITLFSARAPPGHALAPLGALADLKTE